MKLIKMVVWMMLGNVRTKNMGQRENIGQGTFSVVVGALKYTRSHVAQKLAWPHCVAEYEANFERLG